MSKAVRFVEVTVNGPKTWSLAAALHPEVAAAYDAAQDRAATQIIGWFAEHATTRVGPRGRQVQVPVEEIEAAVVRHYTSRAGDPHRHLHLQVNARVFAPGQWRGLHTVGVRDSLEAINGIGHAAVMTDPEFRAALAAHGYHPRPGDRGGRRAGSRSRGRSARGPRRSAATSTATRPSGAPSIPARNPGRRCGRSWDRRAWAEARPDKVVPIDGADAGRARWIEELHELGYRDPTGHSRAPPSWSAPRGSATLDRDAVVATVVSRLGARRSAWNPADIRGEVEQAIAAAGVVADPAVRTRAGRGPHRPRRRGVRAAARPRRTCPSTSGR